LTYNRQPAFATLQKLRAALYDIDPAALPAALEAAFAPDAAIHLAAPFETLYGAGALYERGYAPLLAAIPDLERRDFIVMAGDCNGQYWVGCAGHYIGVFEQPWLDIPATQHLVAMRYHEFFRMEDGRIVEMQSLWDIPQVMMQAGAWPLSPMLAVDWVVPGPATQDGIRADQPADEGRAAASLTLVGDMLAGLSRSPQGVDAMQLDRYWHPKMNWYGPSGIGSMRRISGFRSWHQIPFLKALPDRGIKDGGIFFADADYVGFTAFPGMRATVTGDGWLGIAPGNQPITMRSLDFWRCENGMIRENWVLVDLLDIYQQLRVDVFARMRELTVGRQPGGLKGMPR
jgi:predicted ester cyclase